MCALRAPRLRITCGDHGVFLYVHRYRSIIYNRYTTIHRIARIILAKSLTTLTHIFLFPIFTIHKPEICNSNAHITRCITIEWIVLQSNSYMSHIPLASNLYSERIHYGKPLSTESYKHRAYNQYTSERARALAPDHTYDTYAVSLYSHTEQTHFMCAWYGGRGGGGGRWWEKVACIKHVSMRLRRRQRVSLGGSQTRRSGWEGWKT